MRTTHDCSLDELVSILRGLCARGHSGWVTLITDDNRMGQLYFLRGKITFAACHGRRGREAVIILRTLQRARFSLEQSWTLSGVELTLPTFIIIDFLSGRIENLPESGNQPPPWPGETRGGPRKTSRPALITAGTGVPAHAKARLESLLAIYIGPMAGIICGDHIADAVDLETLALSLAAEIPAPEQAARFRSDVAREFGTQV